MGNTSDLMKIAQDLKGSKEETAKIIARVMNRENDDFCIAKKVK